EGEAPGLEGKRRELLTDAPHHRPPTGQAEGDVGTQPGRHGQIGAAGPAQDGRSVGRPPAEARAGRDPLGQVYACAPSDPIRSKMVSPSPGPTTRVSARSSVTISDSSRW